MEIDQGNELRLVSQLAVQGQPYNKGGAGMLPEFLSSRKPPALDMLTMQPLFLDWEAS